MHAGRGEGHMPKSTRHAASSHEKGAEPLCSAPCLCGITSESPLFSFSMGKELCLKLWARSALPSTVPSDAVSENVGECARPNVRRPRSRSQRAQKMLSLRCSLDSPPWSVASWVATRLLTLFVPPWVPFRRETSRPPQAVAFLLRAARVTRTADPQRSAPGRRGSRRSKRRRAQVTRRRRGPSWRRRRSRRRSARRSRRSRRGPCDRARRRRA